MSNLTEETVKDATEAMRRQIATDPDFVKTLAANADLPTKEWVEERIEEIELTPGPQGNTGIRGSLFLGSFATSANLPAADGVNVMVGDFAYVTSTGELWRLKP